MRGLIRRFEGSLAAYVGATLLLIGAVSTYWDIATHIDVGRDRFLTPAHIGIYSGVLLSAIAIALSGLADHFRVGHSFFQALRHPFRDLRPGIGVAGAGMLTTLIAAPFDNAWHEIYGIDVTIWSPPHLLAIFGIGAAALGLAALISPAATGAAPRTAHFILLSGLLSALVITTGEFEFNGPQYRIAYHPMILSAAAGVVLVAASKTGSLGATKVSLWFEGVRVASVLFLVVLDHSLPFVPLLIPSALAVDLLARSRSGWLPAGLVSSAVLIAFNAPLLELLGGLTWEGDDLIIGTIGALVSGGIGALLGTALGERLAGRAETKPRRASMRLIAATGLLALFLLPTSAVAHEVGGDAGAGSIEWSPQAISPGRSVELRVSDLRLEQGAVQSLDVELRRAEHRIEVSLRKHGSDYVGRFELPEEGPWMMLLRASSTDQSLLATQMVEVTEDAPTGGTHRERFTLGLDTVAANDPPAWLDLVAYGIAIAVALALLRATISSLNRLGAEPVPGEAT